MKYTIQLKKEQNLFFSSDWHLGQKNICTGSSSWGKQFLIKNPNATMEDVSVYIRRHCREFKDENIMSKTIIDNINQQAGKDDWIIFNGDYCFGDKKNYWNYRKQIKCKNIIFVLGNHDNYIRDKSAYLPNCVFNNPYGGAIIDGKTETDDMGELYPNYVAPYRLFTETCDVLDLKVIIPNGKGEHYKHHFFCSHYAHRTWNRKHHGSIHCFGHSHGNLKEEGKSIDVGIDAVFKIMGKYRMIELNEVIDIMKKKEIDNEETHRSE